MNNFFSKYINEIYFNFLFLVVSIIFLTKFSISYHEILGDKWAYNNLFINYSAGFVRRGLLGEIFINIHNIFDIKPLFFFTTVFFIAYFLQIFFFYKIFEKYKNYKLLSTFVILSPVLLFFYIYDLNIFLAKDVFINLSILLHAYIINKKVSGNIYNKFLIFLIIPVIILNMLNHENQFFFIPFHFLFTFYFINKNKKMNFSLSNFKPYILLLIPIFILLSTSGSWEKLFIINDSIKQFEATIPNQFAGNFNLAIGGFIKWHFFYHDVYDFMRLFLCFLLSVFLFYVFFNFLINKKVLKLDNILSQKHSIILLPSFAILFVMLDHGRSLHMLSMHMILFYLLLDINVKKLDKFFTNIKNNFFLKFFLILFTTIYLNFWYLPQGGGFNGVGGFVSMFKGTFANELLSLFLIIFNYIDYQIIDLPRIIL